MAVNVPVMAQPEAYIGGADKLLDVDGRITADGTRKFLERFMHAFGDWVTANVRR